MACRRISDSFGKIDVVWKSVQVPDAWSTENISFPSLTNVECLDGELQRFLNSIPNLQNSVRQAIIQQYNEILIYNDSDNIWREILAPQLGITYDSYNLPIIIYPRFEPLVDEDIVWKTPNHICMMHAGKKFNQLGISMEQVDEFYNMVTELCSEYDLVEDDIVKNPSNIGYNPLLGLRLIDYGLVEDDALVSDA